MLWNYTIKLFNWVDLERDFKILYLLITFEVADSRAGLRVVIFYIYICARGFQKNVQMYEQLAGKYH